LHIVADAVYPAVISCGAELIKAYMYKTLLKDGWWHPVILKEFKYCSNHLQHSPIITEQSKERCLEYEKEKVAAALFSLVPNVKDRIRKTCLITLISL